MLPRLPLLDGPPLNLPPVVDAVSDRWAGLAPRVRFGLVVAVVVAAFLAAGQRATTSRWGATVEAVVTAVDVAAGSPIGPSQVELVEWPRRLLPAGALTELPAGRATATLPAGTVLAAGHVADGGIAATVAVGHVAVPVPMGVLPTLAAGTRVDVVAADANNGPRVLAADARVLGTDEAFTWLEVDREQAGAVASAASVNALSVAVLGG